MNLQPHPLLTALYARGGAAYAGELLSYLLIEVRGECLWITGVTPLRDNGYRFTASGFITAPRDMSSIAPQEEK